MLRLSLLALLTLTAACQTFARVGPFGYPLAPTVEVVDDYHGVQVHDPYRWLEDAADPRVAAWVAAQNEITREFLRTPERPLLQARLTALNNYPKITSPALEAGRLFYLKNDGLQNQPVLVMESPVGAKPQTVLDPNTWSADGTVALMDYAVSRDGRFVAYARSSEGSDWQEIRVRDIEAEADLPEVLRWCKFTAIAWRPDGSGFYYSRFPDPATVPPADRDAFNKVYYHALRSEQTADPLVFERSDDRELHFAPHVTEDGKFLVLTVGRGTDPKNGFYYRRLGNDGDFVRLLDKFDAAYDFVENIGTAFYFVTDRDAPRKRIVAIDLERPNPEHWRGIVAEGPDPIDHVEMIDNRFAIVLLHDAYHQLSIRDLSGRLADLVELPGKGAVDNLIGKREGTEFFFSWVTHLRPSVLYRYEFETGRALLYRQARLPFDPLAYEVTQMFYPSRDGTRIPMSLLHRKDISLDGSHPTILYGYGGFNVSLIPNFIPSRILWLEQGGIFAIANLRGGGEYGRDWHEAGTRTRKQNVFDDFIAGAEWLIARGYTRADRLVISGGSNGGLLVAACQVQRPDLFRVALPAVPVIDMLRYHRFTVGRYWITDYGDPGRSPEEFRALYAYSPLHNIKPGVAYPATLIFTAEGDDRVVPSHAEKFAATLQAKDAGRNPILLRVDKKAGHGRGKPVAKQIEEESDRFAFVLRVLGLAFSSPR